MGCLPRLPPGRKGRSREAPCRQEGIIIIYAAGGAFQVGKNDSDFLSGFISENSRVEITFYFFMGITSLIWYARRSRGYWNFSPDCSSMHRRVLTGMSLSGCLTVVRPFLTGCLYWWWLPATFTSYQPSAFNILITSRDE